MEPIQVFWKKYDQIPSEEKCIALLRAEDKFFKVKQALEEEKNPPEIIQELLLQLIHDLQLLNEIQPKQAEEKGINKQAQKKQEEKSITELLAEERATRINSLFQDHNLPQFFISLDGDEDNDDYDKESIIFTNTDIFVTPPSIAITTSPPVLPIEDPEDSLIMGNEELNTIPEKESDEFIKSSVEDLFQSHVSPRIHLGVKMCAFYLRSKDSYDSNLDEPDLLVTPLSDANEDECFDSGGDVDEINDFKDGYYDSEGDILYLKSLLSDDTTPNLPPEVFLDRDLRSLSDAPIDKLMSEDKIFNPEICVKKFSPTYVSLPFTDRHYLFFTYVVRILLLYFTYPVVSLDCPDYEDSRAHGFVHHPLDLQSFACLYMGI
nr:hypothetical protein [Tanacetum cinerariifolium]